MCCLVLFEAKKRLSLVRHMPPFPATSVSSSKHCSTTRYTVRHSRNIWSDGQLRHSMLFHILLGVQLTYCVIVSASTPPFSQTNRSPKWRTFNCLTWLNTRRTSRSKSRLLGHRPQDIEMCASFLVVLVVFQFGSSDGFSGWAQRIVHPWSSGDP